MVTVVVANKERLLQQPQPLLLRRRRGHGKGRIMSFLWYCMASAVLLLLMVVWIRHRLVHIMIITTTNNNNNNTKQPMSFHANNINKMINTTNLRHPLINNVEDEEAPQLVFDNNLKYRRVCTKVYHANLCMILRYPFEIPLQDPTVSYPHPVNERMYQLRGRLMFVDGSAMEDCQVKFKPNTTTTKRDQHFYDCMEHVAAQYPDIVLAMFIRQRATTTRRRRHNNNNNNNNHEQQQQEQDDDFDDGYDWYGIVTPSHKLQQQQRMRLFFHNHLIVVLGASPTTSIVNCLVTIFGKCQMHHRFHYTCGVGTSRRTLPTARDEITIQVVRYQPEEYKPNLTTTTTNTSSHLQLLSRHLRHVVNDTLPLLDVLQLPPHNISQHGRFYDPNTTTTTTTTLRRRRRPLSIMIEYPIAHMQTHDMMVHYPNQVQYNQERYIQLIHNITTRASRATLASLGFELQHPWIIWDGLPQHFPSSSGAFMEHFAMTRNESALLQQPPPPEAEWHSKYGSNCRGPLPVTSRLTREVLYQARSLWRTVPQQQQHQQQQRDDERDNDDPRKVNYYDDRWYGRIWEFANQFWWQEIMWSTSANPRLDCLHPYKQKTGLTCVHKYFLQAMVDGYYEEEEEKQEQQQLEKEEAKAFAKGATPPPL